jgi:hypothetical protein
VSFTGERIAAGCAASSSEQRVAGHGLDDAGAERGERHRLPGQLERGERTMGCLDGCHGTLSCDGWKAKPFVDDSAWSRRQRSWLSWKRDWFESDFSFPDWKTRRPIGKFDWDVWNTRSSIENFDWDVWTTRRSIEHFEWFVWNTRRGE